MEVDLQTRPHIQEDNMQASDSDVSGYGHKQFCKQVHILPLLSQGLEMTHRDGSILLKTFKLRHDVFTPSIENRSISMKT